MEIGPNCCWANQFAQFVGWGGDIIIGIICVLRPWFDCVDRHVYLLICVLRSNVFNGLVH